MLNLFRLLLGVHLVLAYSMVPAAEILTLGIHPYKSSSKLLNAYTPLAEYLSSELGVQVKIQIAPDYDTHLKRIGKDEVDIAYMGPASYVAMVDQYGKKPIIARQFIKGIPTFQGKIISRSDSKYNILHDLTGARFAFGDQRSTMSHLVPRYMLIEDKVKLASFKFLGSHDNVALGVLSGDYDAGAVKEAVFYKYRNKGLKAIATTPALSEHLFVSSSKINKDLYHAICQAFYKLDKLPQGKLIMTSIKNGISSFGPANDQDYDNLRVILDVLKRHGLW